MKRPLFIARQAGKPAGILGRLLAAIMSRETAEVNDRAVDLLDLKPSDRVLEIGFGHGRGIECLAAAVPRGSVAGLDLSEAMTHLATKRNRRAIADGRVELRTGDSATLPFSDAEFDKALTVHTIYFWPSPSANLRELRRVLRPGARLVLGATRKESPHAQSFPAEIYTFYDDRELQTLLAEAGFTQVKVHSFRDVLLLVALVPEMHGKH